jgi:riboflavin kinase/FMN adenylyltransferase
MRILRGLDAVPPDLAPSVTALGTFDGIHLGHAEILRTTVRRARDLSVAALACTFDPHPAVVLSPARAPHPIASVDDNAARMAECGLDALLVIPFTPEFSRIEAEAFVERVLVRTLRVREVVVGFNHTFGRGARGTALLLRELGARHGFATHVLPPFQVGGQIVSSSAIREALREGDVRLARAFLGRPYSIRGPVLRGAGRGRTLGFPTANLQPERPLLLAPGVYVAQVTWTDPARPERPRSRGAVVNVGYRPTFGENEYWIEAFLYDWDGDLYDQVLSLHFLERLRAEMRFDGVDALKRQVFADIETARAMVAAWPAGERAG